MPKRTIAGDLPAPMLAKLQPEMPTGEGWTYEPKWDGFRTIVAIADDSEVRLASRDGRPMGRYFPEVVEAVTSSVEGRSRTGAGAHAAGSYVTDGEIVRVADGSMDFDELQLRLHPAESRVRKLAGEIPATLVVFDLLRAGGEDLTGLPLSERRERLGALARELGWAEAPGDLSSMPPAPVVLVAPWTDDTHVAQVWFEDEDGL